MKVCYLSSCGRGFTSDLAILHRYISSYGKEMEPQFFIRNELNKNKRYRKAVELEKCKAYRNMDHVISADMSLHEDEEHLAGIRRRILTGAQYEYIFKEKMRLLQGAGGKSQLNYCSYSDILVSSPLMKELLAQEGTHSEGASIKEICSPFGADLCREESVGKVLRMARRRYGFIGKNKMIAILLVGKESRDNCDLRCVMDHFGKDWCYGVNYEKLLRSISDYHDSPDNPILYTGDFFPASKLLYLADILVTNSAYYASSFCAARKPLYVLASGDNWFEKYISSQFSSLFLHNLVELNERESQFSQTEVYQELWDTLSYPGDANPEKYVLDLLTNDNMDGEKHG